MATAPARTRSARRASSSLRRRKGPPSFAFGAARGIFTSPGTPISLEVLLARAPRWLAEPLGRMLRSFSEGLAVLRAPAPHLAKIGLQSLVVWLLIALGFHLNHIAFGIDLPFHATFLLIAFLVVGVAIPTPGMVGGFHAFYLVTLNGVYGVDRATAAAAGISAHALSNLPVLVFGLALLGREGLSLGRVAEVTRDEQKLSEVRP